ncbi:unnamed protein product [Schistosoma curassoni]|uniref:Ovule protein n=1 Tax=Schistosoma curassoni TaxID=6186 RepID=A0A183JWL7_9TREM|nr:unnamed protein product [Schistosoma curassoni]
MLAFQQQLFKPVLGRLFTQPKNKESIYDADNGTVMDISEARPVEGLNLFIPEASCNIGKLPGSQQDNILLNAQEVVTIPDDQETKDHVDEALDPELNEALVSLSNSENKLQPGENYSSRDIGRDSYSENNWSSTTNAIVQNKTQN